MKKTTVILFVLASLLTSCHQRADHSKAERRQQDINVGVIVLDTVTNLVRKTYLGNIEEALSMDLSFKYGGTLEQVMVKEGSRVEKGQPLAEVSSATLYNTQRSAHATLEQARDGYERLQKVYQSGSLPEIKWKEMVANLEKAQANADLADEMMRERILKAPFDGIVTTKYIEKGQNVSPFQPVIRLIQTQGVQARVAIPEDEISSISVGDSAEVIVPALDNRKYKGIVLGREIVASPLSHSYPIKVAINNDDGALLPGMISKVILASERRAGIMVPCDAILLKNSRQFVWIVSGGHAQRRYVVTDGYFGNGVLIAEGLQQGDSLIVEGYHKVCQGIKIECHER